MLNLRGMERICIIGAGTAGWFMALELRRILSPSVEIRVISASDIPIVGVGEGGILNLMQSLQRLKIPLLEFMLETGAVHKLGFAYEGWRNGKADDIFYHMFPYFDPKIHQDEHGYFPTLSLLHNHNLPISYIVDSIGLREKNTSQQIITQMFLDKKSINFASSFHFDAYRVGEYLKKLALKRGIFHHEGYLKDIIQDQETGLVTSLIVGEEDIKANFVVDASGFARLLIGKKFKSQWTSFSDFLIMNKAIPFHLKHLKPHPDLVTRATAMNAGWTWQIPLQERIGAGYVFNDSFINETQAVDELEQWLGHTVDPIKTISFEAGYFQKVWHKNVLAIGLASGFVEPLEATSIGQMLGQIEFFSDLVVESHGVVSEQTIEYFNQQNAQSWQGIGDFIRMHYDTGRNDTPFWKAVLELPASDKYKELKKCWKERTPRKIDFVDYEMDGFSHFGVYSWLAVGQGVGIIPPEATAAELMVLRPEQHHQLAQFLKYTKQRIGLFH